MLHLQLVQGTIYFLNISVKNNCSGYLTSCCQKCSDLAPNIRPTCLWMIDDQSGLKLA